VQITIFYILYIFSHITNNIFYFLEVSVVADYLKYKIEGGIPYIWEQEEGAFWLLPKNILVLVMKLVIC
jgi:hypothetical protein